MGHPSPDLEWGSEGPTADFSPPSPREPVFIRNPEGPVWERFRVLVGQHLLPDLPTSLNPEAVVAGGFLRVLYQVAAFPERFPRDLDLGALLRDHHDIDLWTANTEVVTGLRQLPVTPVPVGYDKEGSKPHGENLIKETFIRGLPQSEKILNTIFLQKEKTPEGVLQSFDLENVQVGWVPSSGEVWVTQGFVDSEAKHQLRLTPPGVEAALKGYYRNFSHAISRVKKYVSRDYLTESVQSPLFWFENMVPWTTIALESRCLGSENIRHQVWTRTPYNLLPGGLTFSFRNIDPIDQVVIAPQGSEPVDVRPVWWALHRWLMWVQETFPQEGFFPRWCRYGTTSPMTWVLAQEILREFDKILKEEYPSARVKTEFEIQGGTTYGLMG